jgi:hypothetical protein
MHIAQLPKQQIFSKLVKASHCFLAPVAFLVNNMEHCHLYRQKIWAHYLFLHGWKPDFKSLGHSLLTLCNAVSFLGRTVIFFSPHASS